MSAESGPRVTIVDVARQAGVSISTVSHVLNGTKAVSPEARRRVEEAIRGLDYRPSHLARSLRRRQSATVGVLLTNMASSPVNLLLKGIVDALAGRGYAALLADSEGSEQREAVEVARFLARQIDGCIFQPVAGAEETCRLLPTPFPCVSLERELAGGVSGAVVADYRQGVSEATAWALRLGYRTAFVTTHVDSPQRSEAFQGYVEALRAHGQSVQADLLCTMPPTPEGGYKAVQRLMHAVPEVSAVIVPDALMTVGALEMRCAGHARAGRLTVVGVDAGGWYPGFGPGGGRIVVPAYEMGASAVQLLEAPAEDPAPVVRMATRFVPPHGLGDGSHGGRAAH